MEVLLKIEGLTGGAIVASDYRSTLELPEKADLTFARQDIRDHLKGRHIAKVADGARINRSTVRLFIKYPEKASFETVKKLSAYLETPSSKTDK